MHITALLCGTLIVVNFWLSPNVFAQSDLEARLDTLERKVDRLLAIHEMGTITAGPGSFLDQTCDDDLIDKNFFVICHRSAWKIPRWVGYHLTEAILKGNTGRTDDFRPDPELSPGARAVLADYRGSGFDRGHMAPAAAFKRSKQAMSTTFLLSNMAPQTSQLNRRIWRLLEEDVRTLTREHGEVWAFTGNIFWDEHRRPVEPSQTIGDGKVVVPTHCFKAILLERSNGTWSMYGFIMPNQSTTIRGDIVDFQVPVDRIEEATGIDFFARLPDAMENDLERQVDPWPITN